MAKEVLRDAFGQLLATIESDRNDNLVIKDYMGKILGTYDKKKNITKNYLGQIVGTGNLLTLLIKK